LGSNQTSSDKQRQTFVLRDTTEISRHTNAQEVGDIWTGRGQNPLMTIFILSAFNFINQSIQHHSAFHMTKSKTKARRFMLRIRRTWSSVENQIQKDQVCPPVNYDDEQHH